MWIVISYETLGWLKLICTTIITIRRISLQKIPDIHEVRRPLQTERWVTHIPLQGRTGSLPSCGGVLRDSLRVSRIQHLPPLQRAASPSWGIPHPGQSRGHERMLRAILPPDPPPGWLGLCQACRAAALLSHQILHLPLPITEVDPWHASCIPNSSSVITSREQIYNKALLCYLIKHSSMWAHFIILSCEPVMLFLTHKMVVKFLTVNSTSDSHPFTFSCCVTAELHLPFFRLAK